MYLDGKFVGSTKVVYKNLNPIWNQVLKATFDTEESKRILTSYYAPSNNQKPKYELFIYDS